jgi:hypothetical protein
MRIILEALASLVIVYLIACLITLKWTPMVNTYINSPIHTRFLLLLTVALICQLVFYVIQFIKS